MRIENGELDSYIRHNEDKCQFESEVSETDSSHSFTSTSLRIQAHKFQQASTVRFVTMTTNNSQLSILHSQFKNAAFTLAEVLVTLTILGVVAALTVPSIVHNNQTRINKTRLKKAMATYDKAISQMSVVSGFKTKDAFKNWAQESDCDNAVSYFKVAGDTREGCKFRTSDGIWWDVSEIDRTIVSFKEENLTSKKAEDRYDYSAFYLITSFDQTNETLRIDDLGYENYIQGNIPNKYSMIKLWDYLGYNTALNFNPKSQFICSSLMCEKIVYDENGREKIRYRNCDTSGNNCENTYTYKYDDFGNLIDMGWRCNMSGESCQSHQYFEYDGQGNRISGYAVGGSLNGDKYIFETDDNHNVTTHYFGCNKTNPQKSTCRYTYKYKYNENNQVVEYYSNVDNLLRKYEYDKDGVNTAQYDCDKNGNNCKGPYVPTYE